MPVIDKLHSITLSILCDTASYSNLIAVMKWLLLRMMFMTFIKFQDWRFRRRVSLCSNCFALNPVQSHFSGWKCQFFQEHFVRLKCHRKWWPRIKRGCHGQIFYSNSSRKIMFFFIFVHLFVRNFSNWIVMYVCVPIALFRYFLSNWCCYSLKTEIF